MKREYHITERDRERFWSKIDPSGECWVWIAKTTTAGKGKPAGYGQLSLGPAISRINMVAHQFAYVTEVGEIPDGMLVLHTCDNTLCVRPSHLFLGTHLENHQDKACKGRARNQYSDGARRGTRRKGVRVSDEDKNRICEIYQSGTKSQKKIAIQFEVSQPTISKILRDRFGRLPAMFQGTTPEQRRDLISKFGPTTLESTR